MRKQLLGPTIPLIRGIRAPVMSTPNIILLIEMILQRLVAIAYRSFNRRSQLLRYMSYVRIVDDNMKIIPTQEMETSLVRKGRERCIIYQISTHHGAQHQHHTTNLHPHDPQRSASPDQVMTLTAATTAPSAVQASP